MNREIKRYRWLVMVAMLTVLMGCNEPRTVVVVVTATPEAASTTRVAPPTASATLSSPTIAPSDTSLPPTLSPTAVLPTPTPPPPQITPPPPPATEAPPPTRTSPPPPPQITAPPPPATPPPMTPTRTRTPPPPPKVTGPPPPIPALPTRTPTRTPTQPGGPPQIPSRFPPDGTFDSQGRPELDVWVVDAGYAANGMTQLTFEVRARVRGRQANGDGIDNVEFLINRVLPDGLVEEVYIHTENNAPYCAFQESSGTTCRRLAAQVGTLWRASDNDLIPRRPIMRGSHTLQVNVTGKQGERWQRLYEFTIR